MTEYGKVFYRLSWLIVGIVVMLGQAMPVFAAKVIDVSATKHNLSMNPPLISNWYSTDETEVCIFCHTPHGASPSVPLWNQYSTTGTFKIYSSATIEYNPNKFPGGLAVESMSRLCLSCHEGTVAINSLVNPGSTGANPTMVDDYERFTDLFLPRGTGPDLTDDLSTMHPVGFDYNDSLGDLEIKPVATGPEAAGLKFIDGSGGEKFLECMTCHDPHVNGETDYGGDDAYNKFLRIPNTSSAMCLACHIK